MAIGAVSLVVVAAVVLTLVLTLGRSGDKPSHRADSTHPGHGGTSVPATARYDTSITQLPVSYPAGSRFGYTPTLTSVPLTYAFAFDFNFDLEKRTKQLTAQRAARIKQPVPSTPDSSTAVAVYSDPALSVRVNTLVEQYSNSDGVTITPAEPATASRTSSGPETRIRAGGDLAWGLHHDYYIVRYLDAKTGALLTKPVVTHFVVAGLLPAPAVNTSTDSRSNVALRWTKVPGATKYLIVTTSNSLEDGVISDYDGVRLVAATTATSWTEPAGSRTTPGFDQNADFITSIDTDDDKRSGTALGDTGTNYQFGVIATDANRYSGFTSYSTDDLLGSLPRENAVKAQDKAFPRDAFADNWDQLPKEYPYSSLDGVTRIGIPQIDLRTIKATSSCRQCYAFDIAASGTDLYVAGGASRPGGLAAVRIAAARYNAGFADKSPKGGAPKFNYKQPAASGSTYDLDHPSKAAPKVAYPVYASNPLARFIAANMIAHKNSIDTSAFTDQPGAPSLDNAINEAVQQNPYVIGFAGYSFGDTDVVLLDYTYTVAQTQHLQQQLHAKVGQVVASVKSTGSSAAIARAINDYLVAHGHYDYNAFNVLTNRHTVPLKYQPTQDATGILLYGDGVCNSYAKAFDAVANAAGLKTVVVSGTIDSDGGRHAWNKVRIDGHWKDVDVTWDDSPGGNRYLLINDSGFTGPAARKQDTNWIDPALIANYATR